MPIAYVLGQDGRPRRPELTCDHCGDDTRAPDGTQAGPSRPWGVYETRAGALAVVCRRERCREAMRADLAPEDNGDETPS